MELPSREEIQELISESAFDDFEEISPSDDPPSEPGSRWAFPPMYRLSQTEGTSYWRVGFDGTTNELVTEYGLETTSTGQKGKFQVSRRVLYINNLHKVILSKALQDVRKEYQDKIHEGYSDEAGKVIDLPRAQAGHPYKDQLKPNHFTRGVAIQPKLDGIRARCWRKEGKVIIYSKEFHPFSWFESIREDLNILFNYLPSGVGLDGELYSHEMTFQKLTSVVKTQKTKHPLNDVVQYYIFDLILLQTDLETRTDILKKAYLKATQEQSLPHLVLLDHAIIHDKNLIKEYLDAYIYYGYEGIVMRKVLGTATKKREIEETWYKPGKNNNLLKLKTFKDEEGTVVDILEGEGRETGLAIIRIKDKRGNVFDVRPRGSFEKRKKWFQEKSNYIGARYTFRYQDLSDTGVPRFPVGIAFRDYE